jgi:hypothetical protein
VSMEFSQAVYLPMTIFLRWTYLVAGSETRAMAAFHPLASSWRSEEAMVAFSITTTEVGVNEKLALKNFESC